ncbi:hypothetical protein MCOR25_006889 [Pyricularia grisea]|nr:hypothetical protein MCOR25_006889 [Pyricularia grisea]
MFHRRDIHSALMLLVWIPAAFNLAQSCKILNWGDQARDRDDDARYCTPPPLDLCTVVAGSGSGGTYDVVVFGGSERYRGSSDVRVLAIPRFRCFRVPNIDRDQCAVVGDDQRQMLLLGGSVKRPA